MFCYLNMLYYSKFIHLCPYLMCHLVLYEYFIKKDCLLMIISEASITVVWIALIF